MERFGYDPYRTGTWADTLDSLRFMLMERVNSPIGMKVGERPDRPDKCDDLTDTEAYKEAMDAYEAAMCAVPTLRTADDLTDHLTEVGERS